MKPEILSLLHSEGRVQLVGYQDTHRNFGKYNAYYIYHNGEIKYGFHVPIIYNEYKNLEKKLYYLGKADDRINERIMAERQKNHKSLNDGEVEKYFNFLNEFISKHN